jgi:hypothetical protein
VPFKVCVVAGAQDNIRVLIKRQNGSNAERRLRGVRRCRVVRSSPRNVILPATRTLSRDIEVAELSRGPRVRIHLPPGESQSLARIRLRLTARSC